MSSLPRKVIAPSVAVRGGAFVFVAGLTASDRSTTAGETRAALPTLGQFERSRRSASTTKR